MPDNLNDDEYIANLLKQDAKNATKKYELVGIEAFNPRIKSGAPKPNKNFLRHIIRQTDNHNAALLAREAEESKARLKEMNRERLRTQKKEEVRKERRAEGRLTPVLSEEDMQAAPPMRRTGHGTTDRDDRHRRRERSEDSHAHRHRSRSREERREKRKREDSDGERSARRSKYSEHHRDRRHRGDYGSEEDEDRSRRKHKAGHTHRRRRSDSRSSSGAHARPSHSDRAERQRRHRDRSHTPERSSRPHKSARASQTLYKPGKSKRQSPPPGSDSDPLEAIVGPLPPNVEPSIRSRGRGAHKANSMGMDSRFSSAYDPAVDVRPPSDAEDDWGQSVEAFRDRQRWKQQGAERLKAAGFTDDQVKKWEKGDNKDEEDVTWTKRGQARDWDRGKVVDEDGDVELKAEWGRLR
ncbi:hypothetical protein CC86DRAFT_447768 [Ophiobolus disseminans]|uniref:Pre-mRNA-splicing factor 38B n=1 Tax=Ophiobolus disseminans TaxID=1469910 RepID=A0A6A6ZSV6_9PLEO|nr:hypothetical protein CC86DRAFT_447768 [Ophiobolus disseminans]